MKRSNIRLCRILRKTQTDAEKKLWFVLRNRLLSGIKFRRQYSVGKYILDIYSPEYMIGIEADGGQHYSDEGRKNDKIRAEYLSGCGIRILRFSDVDILKNIEGVCEMIMNEFKANPPQPSLLPAREKE